MDQDLTKSMVLRYGQIVRIHLQSEDQLVPKGLLLGKGFTDKNVYVMMYANFGTLNNYRESLFQILPRGSFEIHDEFLKHGRACEELLEQRMKAEAAQYHLTMQNRFDEEIVFGAAVIFRHVDSEQYLQGSYECSEFATDAYKLQLAAHLSSLVTFKLMPYQTFQQEGHPIYIDEPLMIVHEKSKCKVDFVKSKRVFVDEEIVFAFNDQEIEIDMHAYEQFRPNIRKPRADTKRFEAVINHGGENFWVLKLHETFEQSREKICIKPFDLCVFQYTENRGYLSVDSNGLKIILKEMFEPESAGIPLDAVWELQPAAPKTKVQIVPPIFQEEVIMRSAFGESSQISNRKRNVTHAGPQSGMMDSVHRGRPSMLGPQYHQGYQGMLQNPSLDFMPKQDPSDSFILRHSLSGKIVTTEPMAGGIHAILNFQDSNHPECFELKNAKKGFEELTQHAYVKICGKDGELQIHQAVVYNRSKMLRRDSSFSNNDMYYKKLNEEDLDYRKHVLSFQEKKSLHAFQVFKVNDELKRDMLLILSSHEILQQFADILKLPIKEAEIKLNDKILADIQETFRCLLAYVMGLKDKSEAEKSENLPLRRRQRYMKDLQMVEVTMDILFFLSYRNGLDRLFKNWKTERDRMKSIYKLSYVLIEKMTKNNPQTKLHVSQWLELFLHQAMSIDDLSVQTSLSELLDDNYHAISKFITKTSLKRLVDLMKKRVPHEKYLKILSCICMCNGKSIINNQINVLNLFYQQIQSEFKFTFRYENRRVSVLCHLGKKDLRWRTLKQFFEESENADDLQSWNYFLSYFDLLGDMCANRNKFAKRYVEEIFPLNILCCIIEDPESIATNAIEPFLKLVHMAYIDCQHYTPIRRIARVREWHTIEKKNDILRTHAEQSKLPENCDLKRIMDFIERYLRDFDYFDVRKRSDNQILYTILQVLKTTLRLGFWASITNLQDLLPNLLKICSCHKDFKEEIKSKHHEYSCLPDGQLKVLYEKTKHNITRMNLDNIQVMKCKMLACEIMDLIIDMETNVRVSKITQIFKTLLNSAEQEESAASANKQSIQLDPSTPSQSMRRVVRNLQSLQEEHQMRKKNSILYQFLDSGRRSSIKKSPENKFTDSNIFKSMASMLRKEQLSEKDAKIYHVDRWIEVFSSLIKQRDLFCKVLPDQFSIEVLFAEQTLYENTKMLQFALSLLNRIYGQRRELIQNFEKILIVASGFTYTLSVESRVTRTKLLALCDNNVLGVTLDNQRDYNVIIWKASVDPKETGIIQDLHYLNQCLKKGEVKRETLAINYEELAPENGLREVFTEREQNHRLHQSLIKCQDLHESILTFIQIAKDVRNDNQLLLKLVGVCYNFLTMLIWNHQENKMDFLQRIPTLSLHLRYNVGCIEFLRELYTNNKPLLFSDAHVGMILTQVVSYCNKEPVTSYYKSKLFGFLRVLLVFNNKALKGNQIQVMAQLQSKQNNNLMYHLNEEGLRYHSASSFRDPRQTTPRNFHSKSNPLWNHIMFTICLEEYEKNYDLSLETKQPLCINAELTYMCTYFEVFSLLIEDRNEINGGKCKHMHPYYSLLQILSQSGRCWPLKRYIRSYINRLYYMQQEYESISQLLIEHDLHNIIEDLQSIIDIKVNQDETGIKEIKILHPARYTFLYSYVYLCLEETLITLNTILNRQRFLDDLEDLLTQNFANQKFKVHLQLLEIGSLLSQVKKLWSHCRHIHQFAKILINIFKSIFKTFDLALLVTREALIQSLHLKAVSEEVDVRRYCYVDGVCVEEEFMISESSTSDPVDLLNNNLTTLVEGCRSYDPRMSVHDFLLREKNQVTLKEQLVESIFEANEQLWLSQVGKPEKVQQTIKKMFLQKASQDADQNEVLNQKHRRLITNLNLSGKFQRFLDEEFFHVCERLNRINDESQRIYQTNFQVISLKEFITNIIFLNIHDPDCFKDDLRVFFIKVLARIITEKNLNNKEKQLALDHWTPEYWSDYKNQIESSQIFLEECGAAELICQLLKNSGLEQRITLTNELLIFGVAFLLGGNTQCQNSLLQKLKEDQTNVMLLNYTTMIRKIGSVVYNNLKIRKSKNNEKVQFSVELIDNFDYFDSKLDMMRRDHQIEMDDAKETAFQKNCLDIMCRSFRFLQLMCENNNVPFKNFIRVQYDKEDAIKLNTMNLIEFTTTQLRIFLKILNKYITSIPNFMLDFLIEVIQLPCQENQLTLCRSTFFEDACYLSQFFAQQKNIEDRHFNTAQEMANLQELYNKILIAVMSVLEGNDDRIYGDLQNKLEPRFLIDIIKKNLEVMQVRDVKDMKKLLDFQEQTFSEEILKILNVLVIKQKIKHQFPRGSKWLEDLDAEIEMENQGGFENLGVIIDILEKKIRNIEIVYQEKNQIIFFPSHPLFDFLSDATKNKIMFTIKRETQREKILGLLEIKDIIFNEIEHNYSLNQQTIPVTHHTISMLHTISAVLSIMVNGLMMLFYNISVRNQRASFFAEFGEEYSILLNMVEFLQLFASILYLAFYLINRAPLCLKMMQAQSPEKSDAAPALVVEENKNVGIKLEFKLPFDWSEFQIFRLKSRKRETALQIVSIIYQVSRYTSLWIYYYGIPYAQMTLKKLAFALRTSYHLAIYEDEFIVIASYVLCSILGVFYKNHFFSLHLFFLFSRISLLNNVFQAISYNAIQLVVVAQLGVLFVYVFAFTSFNTYVDEIYQEDEPEEYCDTLIKCMITLITSEVIGKGMEKWDPIKFFLDTVYFVFFALLFTNIVSGIMIDTFAELRDQRQKIEDDKKNMCFICGVDRVTLEKNKEEEFSDHIMTKHYLWNYIFYIYGLNKKDSTEYTGLEYAISDMIAKEDIQWYFNHLPTRFPMKQSDNSMVENIEILTKRIENLEMSMAQRQMEVNETLKSILLTQNQDDDKADKNKAK